MMPGTSDMAEPVAGLPAVPVLRTADTQPEAGTETSSLSSESLRPRPAFKFPAGRLRRSLAGRGCRGWAALASPTLTETDSESTRPGLDDDGAGPGPRAGRHGRRRRGKLEGLKLTAGAAGGPGGPESMLFPGFSSKLRVSEPLGTWSTH